ncbi:MAG: Ribosomal large subunit pseudouridine synthase D [Verrucomicrobia bacterium ADurb.Bin345]|nr:MAG: Ribosomal large subunit pseudouridine synthase D [Verrucomicrobia bacterium ADurb.Bin345]
MIEGAQVTASGTDDGSRVDAFLLARFPSSTRALVRKALADEKVLLNNRPAAKGARVRAGDSLRILLLHERQDLRVRPDPEAPLQVVFEDDALLVLNKPPGMPVHPLRVAETGTLANALVARHPALAEIGDDPLFPALAHRLDTDTSGLVVAARTSDAYAFLRQQFRGRKVLKEYAALVRGVTPERGKLEHYLVHNPARRGQMIASREAPARKGLRPMRAVTEYRRARAFSECTLLDVIIRTGVTHQIRCQLAAAGFPIAGDALYGGPVRAGQTDLPRHFLHAASLTFQHPTTHESVRFEAPLPDDLQRVLDALR